MAETRGSRRRLRRAAPFVALVVVVVAAGSAAYAANSDDGPSYATGTVTRSDVQQTLDLTGSVQQVNSVSAAFPVSGTVTSVSVSVGQQVSEGQELARIDAAPLQLTLLQAQATLAQASATLQSDENGTSTATNSVAITGSTATATLTAFTGPSGSGQSSSDLKSLERAVTAAQDKAASDQAAVNTALLAAVTACAASPAPSPSPSGSPTPTPSGSSSPHAIASTASGTSCTAALAAVQRAEAAEAAATKALEDAVSKLAEAASQSAGGSSGNGASSGNGESGGGGSTDGGAGSSNSFSSGIARSGSDVPGAQNSSGSSSGTSSAARIGSDQADVTTAQLAVTDAQRNLDAAVLRSPMAGTVASVGLTKGGTAGSTSTVTIVSQGAARVTIDVPLASMPSVKVGQIAYVTPSGAITADKGTVESIGLLPASTSTSTASYPVTVLIPDSDVMQLPTGSSAQVSLVMSTARGAVTVPNSALTRLGTGGNTAFVTVLKNGTATRTRVTTGAVGTLATQVVSGLSVGQTVVLADRSASLPANSSTNTRVFGTGGGGFAGFGGAGGSGGFGGGTRFARPTG